MSKPLVYNYATAEAKIQKQAEEIIQLKEENTNLRIKCRIHEADLDALQGGDAKMNPIPNGTGVMQQIPSEDGSDLISRADAIEVICNAQCELDVPHYPQCDQVKYCDEIKALLALPSADRPTEDYSDLPDIPRVYYEKIVGNMAHEINMLKEQLESADAVPHGRLIDADALIEKIDKEMQKPIIDRIPIIDIIACAPSADAVHGWRIGKPTEQGKYMVTLDSFGHKHIDLFYYGKPMMPNRKVRGKCWYRSDDEWGDVVYDDTDILAWQPLPKPYKGGDGE